MINNTLSSIASDITSKYCIDHKVQIPSRLTDYDYDMNDKDRRFISTYLHTLTFKDRFIDQNEIISLTFSSDACVSLVHELYYIIYVVEGCGQCDADNIFGVKISGFYHGMTPVNMSIYAEPGRLHIYIENNLGNELCALYIDEMDFESFLAIIEVKEIEDMYIDD